MRHSAGGGERLRDEVPARARLERDVQLAIGEALDPLSDRLGCGVDASARDLAAVAVERVEGDLAAVDVESPDYDAHWASLLLRKSLRAHCRPLSGWRPCSFHLWNPEVRAR